MAPLAGDESPPLLTTILLLIIMHLSACKSQSSRDILSIEGKLLFDILSVCFYFTSEVVLKDTAEQTCQLLSRCFHLCFFFGAVDMSVKV